MAEFVTQANFLPARRIGESWATKIGRVILSPNKNNRLNFDRGELMICQEDIGITPDKNSGIVIIGIQFLGSEYYYTLITSSGNRIHARTPLSNSIAVGTKVRLSILAASQVFPMSSFKPPSVVQELA